MTNSCQAVFGESAWGFLDLVIQTLRQQDQRWGYLCKDPQCVAIGQDVITYKATNLTTGIWVVDIIENHCPAPGFFAGIRWGVLPFDAQAQWSATR